MRWYFAAMNSLEPPVSGSVPASARVEPQLRGVLRAGRGGIDHTAQVWAPVNAMPSRCCLRHATPR